jgi:mRNA-degrading endonuclease toxin of MazEF toxin-antitoxin module
MNIGTEINGIRPVIVYKSSTYKYWEDMIVMPITSFYDESWEEKSQDALDVILEADLENGIDHKSLVKIRQLRCVSKKRLRRDKKSWIIKILGSIVNDDIKREINGNIKKMFGLDGNDN